MKTDKEIADLIDATLAVAEEVQVVPVPADLKAKVMARLQPKPVQIMRPQWLRPAITAAAAIVILTVNALTIRHFTSTPSSQPEVSMADPVDQIRSAYALDGTNIY
jgi:hypothetical protein